MKTTKMTAMTMAAVSVGSFCPSAAGDVIIDDESGTFFLIFNKTKFDDYFDEDIYEKALSGKWFYDDIHRYGGVFTNDLDGSGTITIDDQIGIT